MIADDKALFTHLDDLSRERALTDAESILLQRVIRRIDDKQHSKPHGYDRWLASQGNVIG